LQLFGVDAADQVAVREAAFDVDILARTLDINGEESGRFLD
jgi:hypothetical protein